MKEEMKKLLEENDFNVDKTLYRFMGNEELYLKFLNNFPKDKDFQMLKDAYEQGKCEEAFKAAHTLRGVTGNMGIEGVHRILIPMVERLRNKDMDVGKDMETLEAAYERACKVIHSL